MTKPLFETTLLTTGEVLFILTMLLLVVILPSNPLAEADTVPYYTVVVEQYELVGNNDLCHRVYVLNRDLAEIRLQRFNNGNLRKGEHKITRMDTLGSFVLRSDAEVTKVKVYEHLNKNGKLTNCQIA